MMEARRQGWLFFFHHHHHHHQKLHRIMNHHYPLAIIKFSISWIHKETGLIVAVANTRGLFAWKRFPFLVLTGVQTNTPGSLFTHSCSLSHAPAKIHKLAS
jgi:hypothetical protein